MSETGLDVPACVDLVKQGDEDAARTLLNHLYPLVLKVVRAHLPQRTSEEDLVQAVFIKVFTKLEQYAGKVPLEHWVARIAVNTAINRLQSERAKPEVRWADLKEEEQYVLESLASTEDIPASQSLAARELVDSLLSRLGPEDRLVIVLIYLEGKTVEEVKQITGWNKSLIKVRAFRARQKMKKHLNSLLGEKD